LKNLFCKGLLTVLGIRWRDASRSEGVLKVRAERPKKRREKENEHEEQKEEMEKKKG